MKYYGYIRVSGKDQNPERQFLAMQEQQIKQQDIYMDMMSGKDFDRPQYLKLLKKLKKGDVVIIKSIDRLGRDYQEILEQWRVITKEIGADIQVIDMPLLNTNSTPDNLTGIFITDIALQILAYVAETERSFIRQRQAEGIAVAKSKGVHFGCRRLELPDGLEEYCKMWEDGKISLRKAAEALQISHATFYRRCRGDREKKMENCSKL